MLLLQWEVKESRDEEMIDAICGDGIKAIVLALIAILISALMFGGCASGGCSDCCVRQGSAEAAK